METIPDLWYARPTPTKPGPELDLLVAARVKEKFGAETRPYSTNGGLALDLHIEIGPPFLGKFWHGWIATNVDERYWRDYVKRDDYPRALGYCSILEFGETLPHAICRAILRYTNYSPVRSRLEDQVSSVASLSPFSGFMDLEKELAAAGFQNLSKEAQRRIMESIKVSRERFKKHLEEGWSLPK